MIRRRTWCYRLVDAIYARRIRFPKQVTKEQARAAVENWHGKLCAEIWPR